MCRPPHGFHACVGGHHSNTHVHAVLFLILRDTEIEDAFLDFFHPAAPAAPCACAARYFKQVQPVRWHAQAWLQGTLRSYTTRIKSIILILQADVTNIILSPRIHFVFPQLNSNQQEVTMALSWWGSGQEAGSGCSPSHTKVRYSYISQHISNKVASLSLSMLLRLSFVRNFSPKKEIRKLKPQFFRLHLRTGKPTHHLCKLDPATKKILIMNKNFVSNAAI